MLVVMATLDGRTTVETFLSVIHLERYLDTFQRAGLLLAEDVSHLDHDSLVSLGVIATGHRKRILRLVGYIQSQIRKRSASEGQGANRSSAGGATDVPSLDRCQSESDIHSPEAGPMRSQSSNQELASVNVEILRNSSSPNHFTTVTDPGSTMTSTTFTTTSTEASNGALPGGSSSSSEPGQRSQVKPVPKPRTVFNRRRTAPVHFTCPRAEEPEPPSAPRRLSQESICFTVLEGLTSDPTPTTDSPPHGQPRNHGGQSSPSSPDPEGPSPPVPPRLNRPPPHPPIISSSSLSSSLSSSSSSSSRGGGTEQRHAPSRPLSSSPSSPSSPPRRHDNGGDAGRMEMVSNEIYCGSTPLATPLPPPRLTLDKTPERNSCSTLSNNSSGSTRASTDDPEEDISPYCETVYRHTPEDDRNKMEGRETLEDKHAEDHGSQRRWWARRLTQAGGQEGHQGYSTVGGGGDPSPPQRYLSLPHHLLHPPRDPEEDLTISPYASYTCSSERAAPILCGWLDKLSPQGNYVFQKRYVKFDGKNLTYFGSEKDVYPKGVIPLAAIQMARPAKDNKFEIVTTHRIFVFRTDNEAVRQHWVITLQERVRDQLVFGRPRFGPGPHCRRHGALELKGTKSKVYTAINTEHIWLYKSEQCFRTGIGITLIEARGSTIRDGKHRSFDLITPYKTFSFTAESEREKRDWMEALQESIAETLSDYEVAEKIWSNLSNRMCADCRAINPDWASINLCVVICKNCAGQHRGLGTMISKVQSLKLDTSVWSNEIVQLFITVGNDRANDFWAARLPTCDELDCNATPDQRREFIHLKYREGRYRQPHPGFNTQEELLKVLCMAVTEQTLLRTVTRIFLEAEAERLSASNGCLNFHTHTNTDSSVYDEIMQPVIHSGFLYKSTSMHKGTLSRKTREDFKKFWCTVDKSVLLYESEHSADPSLTISTRDILCVGVSRPDNTNNNNGFIDRFRYTFELYLRSEKLYQFGLETADALHSWTKAIGKAATPLSCHCLLTREFERVGTLRYRAMRDPQQWRHAHFVLQKSNLFVCPTNDGAAEDIINLNRLQELSITSESDGQDKKDTLVLVEKGRTLHLQGVGRGDFSLWSGDIHRAAGGKGNSLREQQLSRNDIPIIVDSCIAFITQYGLTHEGIYRKNGATSRIKLLMDEFRKDARNVKLRIGDNFLEDVTDCLKRFFREIDDPVFMMDLHPLWCEAAKFSQRRQRLDRYKDIIRSLPRVHRTTLSALISHLYRVQKCADLNQMCTKNLSLLFAPSLFQTDGKGEHEVKIVEDLIDNYLVVFDIDEEHQTQMELEVSLITTWKDTQLSQAGDLIIEVYLEMKIPDCCITLKVSPTMGAEELTNQVLYLRNVPAGDKDMWMSFEAIEDGQLERPLHPKEKVLEQALQWCKMADPSSAYLVVKKVPKGECTNLLTAYRSEVMKVGLLRCREEPPKLLQGNRFQDRTFQIRDQKLVLLKDKKSIKPEKEWPLKTMKVYIGIRRKLKAPTRWGFTVMMDKHQLFLCCHTEADLWDWITSFLRAQNDQAPPPPVLRRHSSSDISKQRFGTMPLVPIRGDDSNATMLSANQTLRKLHARRTLSMFFPMKAHHDSFEERSKRPDVCVVDPVVDPVDPVDLGEPLYEEVGDFGLQVLRSLQTSFLSSVNAETQEVLVEEETTDPQDPQDPQDHPDHPAMKKTLSLDRSDPPAHRALRGGSLSLDTLGPGALPGGSSDTEPGSPESPRGPQFPPAPRRWQHQAACCTPSQELLLQELSSVFTKKTQETQEEDQRHYDV